MVRKSGRWSPTMARKARLRIAGCGDPPAGEDADAVAIGQQGGHHGDIEGRGASGLPFVVGVEGGQVELGDQLDQEKDQVVLGKNLGRGKDLMRIGFWGFHGRKVFRKSIGGASERKRRGSWLWHCYRSYLSRTRNARMTGQIGHTFFGQAPRENKTLGSSLALPIRECSVLMGPHSVSVTGALIRVMDFPYSLELFRMRNIYADRLTARDPSVLGNRSDHGFPEDTGLTEARADPRLVSSLMPRLRRQADRAAWQADVLAVPYHLRDMLRGRQGLIESKTRRGFSDDTQFTGRFPADPWPAGPNP